MRQRLRESRFKVLLGFLGKPDLMEISPKLGKVLDGI